MRTDNDDDDDDDDDVDKPHSVALLLLLMTFSVQSNSLLCSLVFRKSNKSLRKREY